MCSSRHFPNHRKPGAPPDVADRVSSVVSLALLCAALIVLQGVRATAPSPGEARVWPATALQIELAPSPGEVSGAAAVQQEAADAPGEAVQDVPEEEAVEYDMAPVAGMQNAVLLEGESGHEDAVRTEWLAELHRRIENRKFYPGGARYARETGTVLLLVDIDEDAMISGVEVVENTGSAMLVEGAREILRQAGAQPLSSNSLPHGVRVRVPFSYRMNR